MKKIKYFFDTPKKAVLSTICLVVLFVLIGAGTFLAASPFAKQNGASETDPVPKTYPTSPSVTSPQEPTAPSLQLPNDAQNPADVQPPAGDMPNSNVQPSTDIQNPANLQVPSEGQLSLEEAKAAALQDAGLGASDVTYTAAKLDYDDHIPVYDIEFYTSSHEYEYEIHAQTGAVCHREQEAYRHHSQSSHHSVGSPAGGTSDIGLETAKSIAAGHAGMIVSDVTFSKAESDYDDGYLIYEIEFLKDNVEYEYEIDAVTGEILKFDSDLYD